uniref:Uncharacterized protein n=1 Tax=Aegilops tauschii subsp. strangulata TaxID=200361 RepID=A0A453K9W5_AEGTS
MIQKANTNSLQLQIKTSSIRKQFKHHCWHNHDEVLEELCI